MRSTTAATVSLRVLCASVAIMCFIVAAAHATAAPDEISFVGDEPGTIYMQIYATFDACLADVDGMHARPLYRYCVTRNDSTPVVHYPVGCPERSTLCAYYNPIERTFNLYTQPQRLIAPSDSKILLDICQRHGGASMPTTRFTANHTARNISVPFTPCNYTQMIEHTSILTTIPCPSPTTTLPVDDPPPAILTPAMADRVLSRTPDTLYFHVYDSEEACNRCMPAESRTIHACDASETDYVHAGCNTYVRCLSVEAVAIWTGYWGRYMYPRLRSLVSATNQSLLDPCYCFQLHLDGTWMTATRGYTGNSTLFTCGNSTHPSTNEADLFPMSDRAYCNAQGRAFGPTPGSPPPPPPRGPAPPTTPPPPGTGTDELPVGSSHALRYSLAAVVVFFFSLFSCI